jgi:hypothetical protein
MPQNPIYKQHEVYLEISSLVGWWIYFRIFEMRLRKNPLPETVGNHLPTRSDRRQNSLSCPKVGVGVASKVALSLADRFHANSCIQNHSSTQIT